MKHVFVFDPKAFYNQQWIMDGILDQIGQFFRTQDRPDWSIQVSRFRRDAVGIIHSEVEKASEGDTVRIYAVGGEEILFDCLNGVVNLPNTELAAIPYGETHDFLNIFNENKIEQFKDIPSMVKAKSIPTDMIGWGVNYALNSCYIGLNSAAAIRLRGLKSMLNKRTFIIFSKMFAFFNYLGTAFDKKITAQKYRISIDDRDYSGSYSIIHIANGPYHAGKLSGSANAKPNDGILEIALIKSASPLKIIYSMRRYANGKQPSNCMFLQGKKISIQSEREMWIQLDNEYFRDTNINLRVIPAAIQMVALEGLTYQ
jgi:diacylglycerol kinase family enzyme